MKYTKKLVLPSIIVAIVFTLWFFSNATSFAQNNSKAHIVKKLGSSKVRAIERLSDKIDKRLEKLSDSQKTEFKQKILTKIDVVIEKIEKKPEQTLKTIKLVLMLELLSIEISGEDEPITQGTIIVEPVNPIEPIDGNGTIDPDIPTTIETLTVGPKLEECYSMRKQTCMIVNGGYFYEGIQWFTYEAGYDYKLKVEKKARCNFNKPSFCPTDVGVYWYKLVEVISKTKSEEE